MGFVTEAMEQIKLGGYKRAAEILKENLSDPSIKGSSKLDLMEWIADCYSKEEEFLESSHWYESAAKASLEAKVSSVERTRRAIKDIEKAIEQAKTRNDIPEIKRLTKLKYSLKPD